MSTDETPKAQTRAYLAALPPDVRRAVKAVGAAIRAAAPDATEVFSYGIPGFRLEGRALVWYAGWPAHVSMYPMGEAIRRAHAAQLKGCVTSKGTIRFPLSNPPSAALVTRLVRARVKEVRARAPVNRR
jgi:uncharacterized protein YdhG (YjbR/CyaY superfamily)